MSTMPVSISCERSTSRGCSPHAEEDHRRRGLGEHRTGTRRRFASLHSAWWVEEKERERERRGAEAIGFLGRDGALRLCTAPLHGACLHVGCNRTIAHLWPRAFASECSARGRWLRECHLGTVVGWIHYRYKNEHVSLVVATSKALRRSAELAYCSGGCRRWAASLLSLVGIDRFGI